MTAYLQQSDPMASRRLRATSTKCRVDSSAETLRREPWLPDSRRVSENTNVINDIQT